MYQCKESCKQWSDWGITGALLHGCDNPCDFDSACAPKVDEAKQNITNSLEATRNHIQEAKTLQQDILKKMKIGEFEIT